MARTVAGSGDAREFVARHEARRCPRAVREPPGRRGRPGVVRLRRRRALLPDGDVGDVPVDRTDRVVARNATPPRSALLALRRDARGHTDPPARTRGDVGGRREDSRTRVRGGAAG